MILQNKAAIVIGASRGIGAAAARALAANGARVALVARSVEAMETIAAELRAAGSEVLVIGADAENAATIEQAVDQAAQHFGGLDIALNNAAINPIYKRLGEFPTDQFDRVIAVNLKAVFVAMKSEITAMLASGGGSIVNICSSGSLVGFPMMAAYVASKHAVAGLTKTAALDYAKLNIRVNAIAPGAVMTEMLREGAGSTPEGRAAIEARSPMGRIGEPDEIAEAVVWLASDKSSYVTGVILPVDGGYVVP